MKKSKLAAAVEAVEKAREVERRAPATRRETIEKVEKGLKVPASIAKGEELDIGMSADDDGIFIEGTVTPESAPILAKWLTSISS